MSFVLVCFIALIVGPGSLSYGLWRLYMEIRPRRWATAQGVIAESRIERQYLGRGSYQSVPIIKFVFHFNNTVICCAANIFVTGTPQSAACQVARFPVGSLVTVLVNPQNPREACLEYRITPASWLVILVGALFSALEMAMILF